jgi:CheY-like chemotaxis protein
VRENNIPAASDFAGHKAGSISTACLLGYVAAKQEETPQARPRGKLLPAHPVPKRYAIGLIFAVMETLVATRPRVLIVEDEYLIAADLAHNLRELGYEVAGTAHRAADALRLAETSRPELVLMDISLPGETDGITAAAEIHRRWNIPVIFATARNEEPVLARAKEANPVAYLTKPFRADELNAAIAIALHQHAFTLRLFEEQAWLSTILRSIGDGVIRYRCRRKRPIHEPGRRDVDRLALVGSIWEFDRGGVPHVHAGGGTR